MHIKLDCSCWQNYVMSRWKECSGGHVFGIQHSICSSASWHITSKSYSQFDYKKKKSSLNELDTIPFNSFYPASWDSTFSVVCICTFAQISECGFWTLDIIPWYIPNIIFIREQGHRPNVFLLSKKIYETCRIPKGPVTMQIESANIVSCCENCRIMWEKGYFWICFNRSVSASFTPENG